MATTAPDRTNRNGVRPKYIDLGTDTEGAVHSYRTTDDTVFVVRDGDVAHREQLSPPATTVDDWMAHSERLAGWQERRYGRTLTEMLTDAVEVA